MSALCHDTLERRLWAAVVRLRQVTWLRQKALTPYIERTLAEEQKRLQSDIRWMAETLKGER